MRMTRKEMIRMIEIRMDDLKREIETEDWGWANIIARNIVDATSQLADYDDDPEGNCKRQGTAHLSF